MHYLVVDIVPPVKRDGRLTTRVPIMSSVFSGS
jgi:hypothetical protein